MVNGEWNADPPVGGHVTQIELIYVDASTVRSADVTRIGLIYADKKK